jgi:hypothetical protein
LFLLKHFVQVAKYAIHALSVYRFFIFFSPEIWMLIVVRI